MKEIELSRNLKRRKAILVVGDEETPNDYFDIAGMFLDGEMYSIAIPIGLLDKVAIVNALTNEAKKCLDKAME